MKSYLEIKVPVSFDDYWFRELRDLLDGVEIRWQRGFYHITMVFLDFAPDGINLVPGINEHVKEAIAPAITFDRLDAFTAGNGRTHVIYLTASEIPEDFMALVQAIRRYMKGKGCLIQSDFKLHVTLGRVQDSRVNLRFIKDAIRQVELPDITLDLTEVDYRVFKDYGKPLAHWTLPL